MTGSAPSSASLASRRVSSSRSRSEGIPVVDQPLLITIDGPAGTGKSSVAHRLAARLGLDFLDTGAMYRAAALLAIEESIDPEDGPALARRLRDRAIRFDWNHDPPRVLLGGRDVSERIRDLDVSGVVSDVARQPEVRTVLVERQREIARAHPRLVSEGRDQGSTVFPHARFRFYLDAAPEVRARRRVDQLAESGREVDFETVRRDIARRDELDSTREVGPLVKPPEAIVVDTGDRTMEAVVSELERVVRARSPEGLLDEAPAERRG